MMSIKDNIRRVTDEISDTCAACGRSDGEIRLMAVTKFHTEEEIREAYGAGIRLFGENRVQEALSKFGDRETGLSGAELHLIGSLQRNKAKTAAAFFDCVESCDRDEIIAELARHRDAAAPPLPVLLELNSGEESKRGYRSTGGILEAAGKVLSHKNLRLAGLMTMAPFTDDTKIIRSAFRALVKTKEKVEENFPGCFRRTGGDADGTPALPALPVLSMGMSNDYKIAIEEGATLVRVGTLIFGERGL